jgi:thiosulfate/3-mercaptopyruvate sulfurtransferase
MKVVWKTVVLTGVFVSTQSYALTVPGPLVDPQWVNQHQSEIKILEIGNKAYIPGAEPINYKKIRVKREADGVKAKGMVPLKADWEKMVRSWGVNNGDAVVIVYPGKDAKDATKATRVYWQFKYYGYDNVAIMNGGGMAWAKAKLPLDKKGHSSSGQKGNFTAGDARPELIATTAEVEAAMKAKNQIVDTRDLGQYLGMWHKSYVHAPGHIPGAKLFSYDMTTATKPASFYDVETYRKAAKAMGIDTSAPIITYCNSGHLATGAWFVFHELLGNKDTKFYDGSMNVWTLNKKPTETFVINN